MNQQSYKLTDKPLESYVDTVEQVFRLARTYFLDLLDPRIKGLIDTYKQVSEDLMCDELADSHTAMGASAAYNRVIEDLEGLK
jgi:hypothetical protein